MQIFGQHIPFTARQEKPAKQENPIEQEQRSQEATPAPTSFDPTNGWMRLFGQPTTSGIAVNMTNVLGLSAVYRAVDGISSDIAVLPLKVYFKENGDRNIADNHAIQRLLSRSPNPLYTPSVFKKTLIFWVLMRGNAYAEIIRNANGRPIRLDIIKATSVQPFLGNDGRLRYRVTGTNTRTIDMQDMFHLKGLSEDGIEGKSPITVARESFGNALGAQKFGGQIYSNGAFGNGIMTTDQTINKSQQERIEKGVKLNYSGENNGVIPVFHSGLKYQAISPSPKDLQFIEGSKMGIEDVARIFNFPLHRMGNLGDATFNNISTINLEYVQNTLIPWMTFFEEESNLKFFRENELNYFTKFSHNALLRGDFKTRVEGYRTLWHIGAINQNEIRKLEEMNRIENGDTYYVPLNFIDDKTASDEQKDK